MKLVSALSILAASCHAQSIETLIGELVNKVYRQEGNKHFFNVAPYFVAEYDFQDDGFNGKGSFGNGNGVITYTESGEWDESSFKYELTQAGQAKSSPVADMYPYSVLEDSFESNLFISVNEQGLNYKQSGTINEEAFLADYDLVFVGFTQNARKTTVEMKITRENEVSDNIHNFWKSWMAPNGNTEIDITTSVKNACMNNPFDKACTEVIKN